MSGGDMFGLSSGDGRRSLPPTLVDRGVLIEPVHRSVRGVEYLRIGSFQESVGIRCRKVDPLPASFWLVLMPKRACFGNSSIRINFDVLHLESWKLAAVGHEILVCTTRDTIKPRPLPSGLRELLAPYTLTEQQARQFLDPEGHFEG